MADVIEVVAGVLRRDDGRTLLQRRALSDVPEWSGTWCHPGGKIEPGETPQEALVREWREEVGVVVRAGSLLTEASFDVPYPYRVRFYAVERSPYSSTLGIENVQIADNALALGWFTDEEALLLPGTPGFARVVQACDERCRELGLLNGTAAHNCWTCGHGVPSPADHSRRRCPPAETMGASAYYWVLQHCIDGTSYPTKSAPPCPSWAAKKDPSNA